MENFTKKDLLMIINVYQNYVNDFVNISEDDLDKIYLNVAMEDLSILFNTKKIEHMRKITIDSVNAFL